MRRKDKVIRKLKRRLRIARFNEEYSRRFMLALRRAAGCKPGESLRNVVYGMALRCGRKPTWGAV